MSETIDGILERAGIFQSIYPPDAPVTSIRIERKGPHDIITTWIRGQNVGSLHVGVGDGPEMFFRIFASTENRRPQPPRRFGPKTAEQIGDDKVCSACKVPFAIGDFTTLIPLGPGDNAEARARAVAGRPYNAIALEVHYACATGEEGIDS